MHNTIEQLILDGPRSNETARETADKIVKALANAVTLDWVDDSTVQFDSTVIFGKGYDYDGLEVMRQEAHTEFWNYLIWPDSISSKVFSLYCDLDGLYMQNLTEEEAKAAALSHYGAMSLRPFGLSLPEQSE